VIMEMRRERERESVRKEWEGKRGIVLRMR
jgi:hypothetical protein